MEEKPAPTYRPARALLGWLDPAEAAKAILRGAEGVHSPDQVDAWVKEARANVSARPPRATDEGVFATPPALEEHIEELQKHPIFAHSFQDGWEVRMVDLTQLSPVQGYVFCDHPLNAAIAETSTDPLSLAQVTMPIPAEEPLPLQYIPEKRGWVLTSNNFNLKLLQEFKSTPTAGIASLGFNVCMAPSVLRVAAYSNRLILVDGNHRAFGLLRRGIHLVPALVKRYTAFPPIPDARVMLPESAFLSPNPPFLTDFLKPEFYRVVSIPAVKRMIVIQALERTVYD